MCVCVCVCANEGQFKSASSRLNYLQETKSGMQIKLSGILLDLCTVHGVCVHMCVCGGEGSYEALIRSFTVRVQMDWGNHVCHTHHTQCTFPSDQFVSRWTGAIMYATHTTRSARFLQTSSCPDGLRQSCMPHTPHAVHVSFRSVCVQMDWGNHVCHTHHMQCMFPSDQFVSRWTEAIMYATHTTCQGRIQEKQKGGAS